jgi:hypothetical protein
MSLINDALKRARDADRRRRSAPASAPLEPADPATKPKSTRWLVLAVAVALGLSLWSFSRWASTAPPPPQAQLANAPESPTTTPPTSEPTTAVEPSLSSSTPPPDPLSTPQSSAPVAPDDSQAPAPIEAPTQALSTDPPNTSPTNETPRSNIDPPPPSTPEVELRLQSIIYRLRNPTAVINGQWLHEGDTIADARIIKIEPHQVTLSQNETNRVLTMPTY